MENRLNVSSSRTTIRHSNDSTAPRAGGFHEIGSMPRSARTLALLWSSFTLLQLLACGTVSPASHAWEGVERNEVSACDEPEADQCIVFACDAEAGECGVFACEDVELEAVAGVSLAYGAQLVRGSAYRAPSRPPPFRN